MGLDTDFGEFIKPQAPPTQCEQSKSATVELVKRLREHIGSRNPEMIQLLLARRDSGKEKYGTELFSFNGRDALIDAFQEQCDSSVYIAQHVLETADGLDEAMDDMTPLFMAEERLSSAIQLLIELWNDLRNRYDPPEAREEAPSILLP
jgi:hypothetical protein